MILTTNVRPQPVAIGGASVRARSTGACVLRAMLPGNNLVMF